MLNDLAKAIQKSVPEKGRKLYMPIRAALTAELHGMELKKIFELLNSSTLCERFEYVYKLISQK